MWLLGTLRQESFVLLFCVDSVDDRFEDFTSSCFWFLSSCVIENMWLIDTVPVGNSYNYMLQLNISLILPFHIVIRKRMPLQCHN